MNKAKWHAYTCAAFDGRDKVNSGLFLMLQGNSWETSADQCGLSARQLRRQVADLAQSWKPRFLQWDRRLDQKKRTALPDVTCIVDGVAIETCWNERENYSRKKGTNYNFQVYSTLDGLPVAVVGPNCGARHDAHNIIGSPGTHYQNEKFLADLGYIGCCHCLTPFRKPNGQELEESHRRFNSIFAKFRARKFGSAKNRWRVLRNCSIKDKDLVGFFVRVCFDYEAFHFNTKKYDDKTGGCIDADAWFFCPCNMDHHSAFGAELTRNAEESRNELHHSFLLNDICTAIYFKNRIAKVSNSWRSVVL